MGAISLTMDKTHMRASVLYIILLVGLGWGIVLLLAALIINRLFRPQVKLIKDASQCMEKALKGDFNCRVKTKLEGEGKLLAEQLNKTFEYLNKSLKTIEDKVIAMIGY